MSRASTSGKRSPEGMKKPTPCKPRKPGEERHAKDENWSSRMCRENSRGVARTDKTPVQRCKDAPVQRCQEVPVRRCQEAPVQRCQEVPVRRCQEAPVQKCTEEAMQGKSDMYSANTSTDKKPTKWTRQSTLGRSKSSVCDGLDEVDGPFDEYHGTRDCELNRNIREKVNTSLGASLVSLLSGSDREVSVVERSKYKDTRKAPDDKKQSSVESKNWPRASISGSNHRQSSAENDLSDRLAVRTIKERPRCTSQMTMEECDDLLRSRLEQAKVRREENNSKNISQVNLVKESLLSTLHERQPGSKWEYHNSGSYYDRTKISQADEFDCLLVNCTIRARPVYHPDTGVKRKSCCLLVVNSKYITDLDSIRGPAADQTSVFISPKKIRKYFRDCVNNAIQNIDGRTIRGLELGLQRDDGSCPAITIIAKRQRQQVFSIDIVPAIPILEWPALAKSWKCRWLPKEVVYNIRHPDESNLYPVAIAKIDPSEYETKDSDCKLWRISFTLIEKDMILHADGAYSKNPDPDPDSKTHKKDVLKLLKLDLQELRSNLGLKSDDKYFICSFYLKTIFLRLLDRSDLKRDDRWTTSDIRERYVDFLEKVTECLEMRYIEHYFIPGENFLDYEELTPTQFRETQRFFEMRLREYKRET